MLLTCSDLTIILFGITGTFFKYYFTIFSMYCYLKKLTLYTIKLKVYSHCHIQIFYLNILFQISSVSFAVIITSTLMGKLSARLWNIAVWIVLIQSPKNIGEVREWCQARRPGMQSAFQFIPTVINVLRVRAFSGDPSSSKPTLASYVFINLKVKANVLWILAEPWACIYLVHIFQNP